jgi:hypothetical protein
MALAAPKKSFPDTQGALTITFLRLAEQPGINEELGANM